MVNTESTVSDQKRRRFDQGCVFSVFGCVGLVVAGFLALMLVAWIRTSTEARRHQERVEPAELRIPVPESSARTRVRDAARASPADVEQADDFLQALPASCGDSTAQAERDGSITLHVRCDDGNDRLNRFLSIENGIVREVR